MNFGYLGGMYALLILVIRTQNQENDSSLEILSWALKGKTTIFYTKLIDLILFPMKDHVHMWLTQWLAKGANFENFAK